MTGAKAKQPPLVLRLYVEPLEVRRGTALLERPLATPHASRRLGGAWSLGELSRRRQRGEDSPLDSSPARLRSCFPTRLLAVGSPRCELGVLGPFALRAAGAFSHGQAVL